MWVHGAMQLLRALVVVSALGACNDPAPGARPAGAAVSSARISFELDGVAAATAPRGGVDSDPHSGQLSNMTDQLALYFYGDAPTAPRRGFLSIIVRSFPRTAGEATEARAILTRYEAGKNEPQYAGPVKLVIASFEPGPGSAIGKTWIASGTFAGELPLQIGQQSDVKTTKVTNGVFESLPIQEIGKPR